MLKSIDYTICCDFGLEARVAAFRFVLNSSGNARGFCKFSQGNQGKIREFYKQHPLVTPERIMVTWYKNVSTKTANKDG